MKNSKGREKFKEYEVEIELDMKFVDTVKAKSKAEAAHKAMEKLHGFTEKLPPEHFMRTGFDNDELPVSINGEEWYGED